MRITALNTARETIGIITNYTSLKHTKGFAHSGSFTLKIPFTEGLRDILVEENYLYWVDDCGGQMVYIDSVICELTATGETITASGKNLRGLLGRRIIWENITFAGTVEDFGRLAVAENVTNPVDTDRTLPITLGDSTGSTASLVIATEHENVEDLLDDLTALYGVGFDVLFDPVERGVSFVAYEGADRRTTQSEIPWVVVSRDRNNVVSALYTRSKSSYRNTALISGYTDEDSGEEFQVSILAGSGLDRYELYVSGSTSTPSADEDEGETEEEALAQYTEELLEKGAEKLAAQVDTHSLEVELDTNVVKTLAVGDKVTAIDKTYNLLMQTYISEITAYYEGGSVSYDVTLGDTIPTIYEKLKKGVL